MQRKSAVVQIGGISAQNLLWHLCGMAKDDDYFRLRIPPDLKAQVNESAKRNDRSITAEIIYRVRQSLDGDQVRDNRLIELSDKVDRILNILETPPDGSPEQSER